MLRRIGHWSRAITLSSPRQTTSRRRRSASRSSLLEARTLLAATIYTVNLLSDTNTGSGLNGDLRYVINQANANTNPDGSLVQFAVSVFASSVPRPIVLSKPLTLSEKAGPEIISGLAPVSGPAANPVTISGNAAVEVFHVLSGVNATLSSLNITSGMTDSSSPLAAAASTMAAI